MIILQKVPNDEFALALSAEQQAKSKAVEDTPRACVCEV
jgi:hypothetical protein